MRSDIISKLDVREAPQQTTYLGLPSIIGRKKKCMFQAIIDKVRKKIIGWKERNLSIGGKEVMLKSVAQAMLMYVMNLFMLPDESINEIHRAFNCYWWGNGNKDHPIRWASWESMCISKSRGSMGFRHMKAFNKALLVKQGWRLITMENSLPARILKAMYYPRNSFLDARIGYKLSFVWRSLCSARDIIRKGKRWNIGNRMKVRILEDYWLEGFRTLDYQPQKCEYNVISNLLDADTGAWNLSLLLQLFPQHIATKIACTHTNTLEDDSLYSDASSNGMFTCKSAYWMETETIECFQESLVTRDRKSFKYIWLADVPGKVKIFTWRACMNLLPTISNLTHKGLAPRSLNCVHCSDVMEDTKHALFLCNWARDVWSSMNLIDITDHVAEIPIEDMLTMAKDRGQRTLEIILMVMWRIWCARNSKARGREKIEPSKIQESARGILEDFNRANADSKSHNDAPNFPSQALWSPPCNGVIKINTDGGISSGNSVARIGFVMRCHDGSVLFAGNRRVAYAKSVLEIEAYAIVWAVQVAVAKSFRNVILETDSSILVDAFQHNKELLHIRGLFLHIRRLCGAFSSCCWSFVWRDGNRVAHELASMALYNNVDEVYDGSVPSSINSWVLNDVISLRN